MSVFTNILLFLVEILFSTYITLLVLRILLQYFRASIHNPICQFIATFTDPIVLPLRRVLPRTTKIDVPTVIWVVVLDALKYILFGLIAQGVLLPLLLLLILVIIDIPTMVINIFFYAILIRAILSWLNPTLHNSFTEIVYGLSEPLLRWVRRYIPAIAGYDLSALFALLGLEIIAMIILSYKPVF